MVERRQDIAKLTGAVAGGDEGTDQGPRGCAGDPVKSSSTTASWPTKRLQDSRPQAVDGPLVRTRRRSNPAYARFTPRQSVELADVQLRAVTAAADTLETGTRAGRPMPLLRWRSAILDEPNDLGHLCRGSGETVLARCSTDLEVDRQGLWPAARPRRPPAQDSSHLMTWAAVHRGSPDGARSSARATFHVRRGLPVRGPRNVAGQRLEGRSAHQVFTRPTSVRRCRGQ